MTVFFIILWFIYICAIVVFFALIEKGTWHSFFWSNVNWKATVQNELWYLPYHGSDAWGVDSLLGDHDAARAGIVALYRDKHLPWQKVEDWLWNRKKKWREKVPVWLTEDWLKNLRPDTVLRVWKGEERRALKEQLRSCEGTSVKMETPTKPNKTLSARAKSSGSSRSARGSFRASFSHFFKGSSKGTSPQEKKTFLSGIAQITSHTPLVGGRLAKRKVFSLGGVP